MSLPIFHTIMEEELEKMEGRQPGGRRPSQEASSSSRESCSTGWSLPRSFLSS